MFVTIIIILTDGSVKRKHNNWGLNFKVLLKGAVKTKIWLQREDLIVWNNYFNCVLNKL